MADALAEIVEGLDLAGKPLAAAHASLERALELAVALAGRVPNLAGGALILVVALALLYLWSSRAAIPAAIALGAALGWLLFAVAGP